MNNLKKEILKVKSSHSISEAREYTQKRSKMYTRDAEFDSSTAICYQDEQPKAHKKKGVYVEKKATDVPINYKERNPNVPRSELVVYPPHPIPILKHLLIPVTPDRSTSAISVQYVNDTEIIKEIDRSKKRLKKKTYETDPYEEWITSSNILNRESRNRSTKLHNDGDRGLESDVLQFTKDISQTPSRKKNCKKDRNIERNLPKKAAVPLEMYNTNMKYMLDDVNSYYDVEKELSNQQLFMSAYSSNIDLEIADRQRNIQENNERRLQTFEKSSNPSKQYYTLPHDNEKYEIIQLVEMADGQLVEYYHQKSDAVYKRAPSLEPKVKQNIKSDKNKKAISKPKISKPSKKKNINKDQKKRKEPVKNIANDKKQCQALKGDLVCRPMPGGGMLPTIDNKHLTNNCIVIPKEKPKTKKKSYESSSGSEQAGTPVTAVRYYTADLTADYSDKGHTTSAISIPSKCYEQERIVRKKKMLR